MRAKPKSFDPLSWPSQPPVVLDKKYEALLLEDLDLDLRRHKHTGHAMLNAVRQCLQQYSKWAPFNTTLPTNAERLAELRRLAPKLATASRALSDLSPMARQTIIKGTLTSQQNERALNSAQSDLYAVAFAIQQAIKNLSTIERRGRKADPVRALVEELCKIFIDYDKGKHEDKASRYSACRDFVSDVLTAAHIKVPTHLIRHIRSALS